MKKSVLLLMLTGLMFEVFAINITNMKGNVYINGELVRTGVRSVVQNNGIILLDGKELTSDDIGEEITVAEETHPFANNGVVDVKNDNGSVTIKGSQDNTLTIKITKRTPKDNPDCVVPRISIKDNNVVIESQYPPKKGLCGCRIDFEIFVPQSTQVFASSTNGSIDIDGIRSVKSYSRQGKVTVNDAQDSLEVETKNGSIFAQINNPFIKKFILKTSNGKIDLNLTKLYPKELYMTTENGSKKYAHFLCTKTPSIHNSIQTKNGGITVRPI